MFDKKSNPKTNNPNQKDQMIVPFDYQEDCLSCLLSHRAKGERCGNVVMATGLGKTYTVAFDVQRYLKEFGGRVLYLCHMTDILYQAQKDFMTIMGAEHTYGFFHGKEKNFHEVECLFSSFDTMNNWLDLFDPEEFDYIVVDESHHAKAETFSKPLEYFKPKFLLGVTATPDRMDNKDIREIFGLPIFNLPLEKALGLGYLTPVDYRILTDEIQLEGALATPERRWSISALNRLIFAPKRDEEIVRIIGSHVDTVEDPRMIVFCSSIAHCDHLVSFLPNSLAIHSGIPQKERDIRLEMFRQGLLDTVVTVDCFNEGIDVPRANVIVFLRSSASRTIFLQQLGRGLRKCKGKDRVLVLDFVANLERIKAIQAMHKEILEVVKKKTRPARYGKRDFTPMIVDVGRVSFQEKLVPFEDLLDRILPKNFYQTWEDASKIAIALGIKTQPQYSVEYRKDKRLPSNPPKTYKNFPGWDVFLGTEKYATWQEAKAATEKLQLTSAGKYKKGYFADEKLPSNPNTFYQDFPGWGVFLGTNRRCVKRPYSTWKEASSAAIALGIKSMPEYEKRYKEDPRLPASPRQKYGKDYPSNEVFFGGEAKEHYATWQEAAAAVKELGITGWTEYRDRYSEDKKLPSNPHIYYGDFPGLVFFGKGKRAEPYESWQEAGAAAIRLGVTGQIHYKDLYKSDPHLRSAPHKIYSDFPGWNKFLRKE